MGTSLDAVNEFEDLAQSDADALTALVPLTEVTEQAELEPLGAGS